MPEPVSDLEVAQCVFDTYWATSKLTRTLEVDGVFVGIRELPDAIIHCFRGSTTFLDWVRDFECFAQMVYDRDLGGVHPGFLAGMREVTAALPFPDNKPTIITGHSLGAARAWIYAALRAKQQLTINEDRVVVFGSPLPGAQRITDLIKSSFVDIKAYKNRHDPVADVPFSIPIVDPYVLPTVNQRLDKAPPSDDWWGVFADHHFELYYQALGGVTDGVLR